MGTELISHTCRIVDLPPELFGPITQHLSEDRKALCAISLVCRILQDEAQRQLYRKMVFSPQTPGTHIKFLKSILDNNRLAVLVHEYAQINIAVCGRGTLWGYLCRGLRAMINLQVLKFQALNGQPCARILGNCAFQLRSLVWGNPNDEDHLSKFLLSQHNLQTLDIPSWAEAKRDLIPPSCCPRLRVLCGNQGALETFLPSREIISLTWRSHSLILEDSSYRIDSLEHLLPYLSRIRFLSFGESFDRACIRSVVRYFPFVEVFRLGLPEVDLHDASGPLFSASFDLIFPFCNPQDSTLLSQLKELQVLVISGISGFGNAYIPVSIRVQIIRKIFERCEKLKQIHVIDSPEGYQTYRWTADLLDVQPTFTFREEVHRWWLI